MYKKADAALRNLELLKKDLNLKGANAQTVNSIAQVIRQLNKDNEELAAYMFLRV